MGSISIFGLGYVGAVSAVCLASEGHSVVGVDPNARKVELINAGQAPIVETDLERLITASVERGLLRATTDAREAVRSTDVSLVCVGTPSQLNGDLDLSFVHNVCAEIGMALRDKNGYHVVAIRSTVLPGTLRNLVIPALELNSGKRVGSDFGVCFNPEFLRESTAVWDFYNPPKTVIGEIDSRSGDSLVDLYGKLDVPLVRTSIEVAEMVKYTDNAWHALKVVFANEIGTFCKAVGVDSSDVMDVFVKDTKLNLSRAYLNPGFAFGGSCLPKDLRALNHKARTLDLDLPVLNSILPSNKTHIDRAVTMVTSKGKRKIGVLGFAFKAGTDDLRESPIVEVVERLLGKGYDIRLYDSNVRIAALTGANRDYIVNHIPHLSRLMVDSLEVVLDFAEIVIVGNNATEFGPALLEVRDRIVIDLAHLVPSSGITGYEGLCW